MAKRKNSPALFEVIGKPKESPRPSAAAPAAAARGKARPTVKTEVRPASPPIPKPAEATLPMAAALVSAPAPARVSYPPISVYPAALARPAAAAPVTPLPPPPTTPAAAKSAPALRPVTANLRVAYVAAIVGVFVVVAGILVGVALARRGRNAPVIAGATSDQLRGGPADPGVMDLSRPPAGNTLMATAGSPAPAGDAGSLVVADAKRSVGLNYVVIQSYAPSEEKLAVDACAFLNRNSLPCTIERDVTGWTGRLVLVGMTGFTHVKSAAFTDYLVRIQLLSTAYAPGKNSYRAFAPMAKKWDQGE